MRLLSFLALMSLGALAAEPPTPVAFDRQLVLDLAHAYLKAWVREHPLDNSTKVFWDKPLVAAARIDGGRELIFVGFKDTSAGNGLSIVFEKCHTTPFLVVSHAGYGMDVVGNHQNFARMHGTNEAGPYTACPEGID